MVNIILFGPPGSGKGTQGKNLASHYNLMLVSTGEILRQEIAAESPLGLTAKKFIEKGSLVPDEVIIDMMEKLIKEHLNDKGLLFDGFPRTVAQAEALDKKLAKNGQSVTALLELSVPEEELVERLLKRKEIEGRSDDNIDTINNRLKVYHSQTEPIVDHYHGKGKHHRINGVGEIEEIAHRLHEEMEKICS
ncbi:adenylate kinase [Bacteroidales bacterium KA00251]|nr:adenylate kinase [Bacteroidales bacterium KA00251]